MFDNIQGWGLGGCFNIKIPPDQDTLTTVLSLYNGNIYTREDGLHRLTNIGIPIIMIRLSHDRPIFIMGIPIPAKMVFMLRQGPGVNTQCPVYFLNSPTSLDCLHITWKSHYQRQHYVISRPFRTHCPLLNVVKYTASMSIFQNRIYYMNHTCPFIPYNNCMHMYILLCISIKLTH